MKKTYINPATEIVKLNIAQSLLIGSPASFDGTGGGSVKLTDDDPDDGEAMGRSFDW